MAYVPYNTIFTWMQEDPNETRAKRKYIYPRLRYDTPKIKCLLRKNILLWLHWNKYSSLIRGDYECDEIYWVTFPSPLFINKLCGRVCRCEFQMHKYLHVHTYILWIHKCVIMTVGCGTSLKYINIQIYSVQYNKHFTKTVLYVNFTHTKFICTVKGVCM